MISSINEEQETSHSFTFLTNYAHVLIYIARETDVRMRELAFAIGITERAVQRIVEDLTESGYLEVTKSGRRNHYQVRPNNPLRHPLVRHRSVGDFITFMYPHIQLPDPAVAELVGESVSEAG